ncbi:hypothetical protein BH11MYX2_BH11MYX2_39410 [soil metagenome]
MPSRKHRYDLELGIERWQMINGGACPDDLDPVVVSDIGRR